MRLLIAAALVPLLAALACTDAAPTVPQLQPVAGFVDRFTCEHDPNCALYAPDPNPEAAGIWMGPTLTGSHCYPVTLNDLDHDNADNECEDRLAEAFRPLLRLHQADLVRSRQTYYAARAYTHSSGATTFMLLYMLGYHMDGGSPNSYCNTLNSFAYILALSGELDACDYHFGDSEWILLQVRYNASKQHWAVTQATLSAHWETSAESSGTHAASAFYYPEKTYGYPRVWASREKHANYPSSGKCDQGAFFFDTCDGNDVDERVVINGRNVGSEEVRFIDQTYSDSPYLHTGTEYFWSPIAFCGWDGPSINHNRGNCAGMYRNVLDHFGF